MVGQSALYREASPKQQQYASYLLTTYLEDSVAEGGHWHRFTEWHHQRYGTYLPFYELTDDYLPDDIHLEDVAFVLWAAASPSGITPEVVTNPLHPDLLALAQQVYERMDERFEQAPVGVASSQDWLIPTEQMQKERLPLQAAVPGSDTLPAYVERFLEASQGEPLMFFSSYTAMKDFFIGILGWENKEQELLPDLAVHRDFILYANAKGMLVAPDVCGYFADSHNPLYQPEVAAHEAYRLFCEQGRCPFDLLKFGMDHRLLTDAQFPFEHGKELLQQHWDFVARWFLGEYYEGE